MAAPARVPWMQIGGAFPPSLNKVADPAYLSLGESPNATGIDPDKAGYLVPGACPTAQTEIAKTYAVGVNTYNWWFHRLWRISGTRIIFGAPNYHETYFAQDLGFVECLEDSNSIIDLLPLGRDSLVAFKTTGAYILNNAADPGAGFQRSDLIQEAYVPDLGRAIRVGGMVYFSNAKGLFSIQETGEVSEITLPVRTSIAPFNVTGTVGADYDRKYVVIGGTTPWCYDTVNKKLFAYGTPNDFLYTTPSLMMKARGYIGNPFVVDALAFEVLFTAAQDGSCNIETKTEDRDWSNVTNVTMSYDPASTVRIHVPLERPQNGRTFALRVTSLSAHVYVKAIYASVGENFMMGSYTE